MATKFTADMMATKLEALYGTLDDTIGDRYMAWVADNGPEWEDIVSFIETETQLPFVDGWNVYWATPVTP